MKVTIEKAQNGYILEYDYEYDDGVTVQQKILVQENECEAKTFQNLVYELMDQLEVYPLRDEPRFYAVVAPHPKSDDFTDAHEKVLFNYDED